MCHYFGTSDFMLYFCNSEAWESNWYNFSIENIFLHYYHHMLIQSSNNSALLLVDRP